MQVLADLLISEQGRDFLYSQAVFTNPVEFQAVLALPVQPELSQMLGGGSSTRLICSGQQVYLDYNTGVVSKISTLQALALEKDLATFFVWHDTDRSGSDPLITKFEWFMNNKSYPLKIAPPHQEEVELRLVKMDPALVQTNLEKLKNYLFQSHLPDKKLVTARFETLTTLFLKNSQSQLGQFNYELSTFLFEQRLGWNPPSMMLSRLIEQKMLNEGVNIVLNNLSGYIRVYNQAIVNLIHKGIDPIVRPLTEQYLPLFWSCEKDNRRLRLLHEVSKGEHYAVARCKCDSEYRFYLGKHSLSMDELAITQRWSPDVSLPIILNRQVSGFVMGKSSALYGLIMKEVLAKVLAQKPVPFLIPETLKNIAADKNGDKSEPDSLLYDYLSGKESNFASLQ
jgi:hypothetical protein